MKKSKLKLIMVVHFDPFGLLTIQDGIGSFKLLSRNEIYILNLFPYVPIQPEIDLADFDGVIIHNTLAYLPQTLNEIDENLVLKLRDYKGVKVLLKQDEHIQSHETARIIGEKKFDLVFSCLPENEVNKVYPPQLVGEAKIVPHYTGYVSDELITLASSKEYHRYTDIAYRGSMQPLQCGLLGYQKWQIGQSIQEKLTNTSIKLDISSELADRFHGADWIKFLQSSKATLGVESGSNIFDFNGEVEEKCKIFERENQGISRDRERYYRKAHEEFLFQYEGNVQYAQVSPRHFEAAATRTLQILYEGAYSNIFLPNKHYLPLKSDLSNIEEIVDIIFNAKKRALITDCAYEEIVLNKKYRINEHVAYFDEQIESCAARKLFKHKISNHNKKSNVFILVPHEVHLDPRIRWLSEGFSDSTNVICAGLVSSPHWWQYQVNQNDAHINLAHIDLKAEPYDTSLLGKDYFSLQQALYKFAKDRLLQIPTSSFYDRETLERHAWYCKFFIRVDKALRSLINQLIADHNATPDLIVCCDLPALLPGVMISQKYGIPLVYDAHEFWAYADAKYKPWETEFWEHYESMLLNYVDIPVTVSKGLAKKMGDTYNKEFLCVPNAELKRDYHEVNFSQEDREADLRENSVTFLYQGGFAEGRGLERLISIWRNIHKDYTLILRGPENSYLGQLKALADQYNLRDRTIFFKPPVSEAELVAAAAESDVGIIPYDPHICAQHKYCCPNKLSQFMAAGLPIISNKLPGIAEILDAANCGFVVDFDEDQQLIELIHNLGSSPDLRREKGANARKYFLEHFNWEQQASFLYTKIDEILSNGTWAKRWVVFSPNSLLQSNHGPSIRQIARKCTNTMYVLYGRLPKTCKLLIPAQLKYGMRKLLCS